MSLVIGDIRMSSELLVDGCDTVGGATDDVANILSVYLLSKLSKRERRTVPLQGG